MDEPVRQNDPAFRELLVPGLRALRLMYRPFALVQIAALAVVIAYYHWPGFAESCEVIGRVKLRFGYAFSFVAGVMAGAIVPEVARRLTLRGHRRLKSVELMLDSAYFGFMGVICDGLYRLLGIVIGTEPTIRNAVLKMCCDMFLFSPTLGMGIAAVYFPLREQSWNFRAIFAGFGPRWYVRRVAPLLITGWCYWMPMTLLLYSLPMPLQMPFSASATAAWSLLMLAITRRTTGADVAQLAEQEAFARF